MGGRQRNVLNTLCMRVWSPWLDARVGHAWLKVKEISSARLCDDEDNDGVSRVIEIVRLGLAGRGWGK